MKRLLVIVICLSVISSLFMGLNVNAASPGFEIPAEYAYLVNTDTGTVVYEKNGNEKAYPASLTKIKCCKRNNNTK